MKSHAEEIISDAEIAAREVSGRVPVRAVASVGHPVDILLRAAAHATVVVVGVTTAGATVVVRNDAEKRGKGYALDRMLALTKGEATIDFGGQLIVRGSRGVAIAAPDDRASAARADRLGEQHVHVT